MQHSELNGIEKYGIKIHSSKPWRDGYLIVCDKGRFHYKKSTVSLSRISFIHGARMFLKENGFNEIDDYLRTMTGEPYVLVDDSPYTMTFLPEGRECNFDDETDVLMSVRLLARFHKASKGYVPPADSISKDELGKSRTVAIKRLDEIKKFHKLSIYGKNEFHKLFNEKANYFIKISEDCIKLFESEEYKKCIDAACKDRYLSHHDLTYQNIIINEDIYYLTNFDCCCFDIKVYDVANIIRRKMRKCDWDLEWGRKILYEYRKIEPLSEDDLFVLKILLLFPQKLWRVINKYNNSNHMWSQKFYIQKLKEVLDELPSHKIFIEQFESII